MEVIEARLSHLAYAPEIAGAMLQRRKAHMVMNLLVVLCGHSDAQPVLNAGSMY